MKKILLPLAMCMALSLVAQLQNAGFEEWVETGESHSRPIGWLYMNPSYMNPGSVPTVQNFYNPPATNAVSGTYGFTLSVWYNYVTDRAFQAAPIATRPTSLRGWYIYTMNTLGYNGMFFPDSALVVVALTRWNDTTHTSDTLGYGRLDLGGSDVYQLFEVPITYVGNDAPDSVKVLLDPSKSRRTPATMNWQSEPDPDCSFFTVDALELVDASAGTHDIRTDPPLSIYPNPSSGIVHLPRQLDGTVCDSQGRLMQAFQREAVLDIQGLPPGVYTLRTTDGRTARILRE